MKRQEAIKVEVDRFEGDLAVLVLSDDDKVKFNLPRKYLPEGIKSGDHLTMSFKVDKEARAKVKGEIEDLLKELTGGGKGSANA
ncbi:MAG TPA: DUF3006 domain-containing protein [Blastocatellia bacterium]|nr:DUF3006 domain-containing protein [Blastocatellia bacterium]